MNDSIDVLRDAVTSQLLVLDCTQVADDRINHIDGRVELTFSGMAPVNAGYFSFSLVSRPEQPWPVASTLAAVDAFMVGFIAANQRINPMTVNLGPILPLESD